MGNLNDFVCGVNLDGFDRLRVKRLEIRVRAQGFSAGERTGVPVARNDSSDGLQIHFCRIVGIDLNRIGFGGTPTRMKTANIATE
ncbi:MAG: hypothetical protein WCD07_04120 [Burkholderiales bacterium]